MKFKKYLNESNNKFSDDDVIHIKELLKKHNVSIHTIETDEVEVDGEMTEILNIIKELPDSINCYITLATSRFPRGVYLKMIPAMNGTLDW